MGRKNFACGFEFDCFLMRNIKWSVIIIIINVFVFLFFCADKFSVLKKGAYKRV